MRKAFNFYRSYYEVAKELNDKDKIAFLWALLQKQFDNIDPKNLTGLAKFAYISQEHSINQQVKGYIDKTKDPLIPPCQPPSVQEKEKEKEKEEEKGKEKQAKDDFVSLEYLECYSLWLEYKKQRKESYKTIIGREAFYNKLLKLSNNNPNIASQIIKQSIENNWSGIFELKNTKVELPKNNTKGTIENNHF